MIRNTSIILISFSFNNEFFQARLGLELGNCLSCVNNCEDLSSI